MAYLEQTKVTNINGDVINPAERQDLYTYDPPLDVPGQVVRTAAGSVDDQIILLRRIVKLLESQGATDAAQRARFTLDSITAGVTLPTITTVGTVTTVTTVTTVSTVTGVTTVSTVNNLAALAGYDQRLYIDWARTAYNTGPRSLLTFS